MHKYSGSACVYSKQVFIIDSIATKSTDHRMCNTININCARTRQHFYNANNVMYVNDCYVVTCTPHMHLGIMRRFVCSL
jgi:hypothetical protein